MTTVINGIDYFVEYSQETGYIEVSDNSGIVASGQMDDSFESFCFEYEDPEDSDFELKDCNSDMYFKHNTDLTGDDIAIWLVNTHPAYN